MVGGEQRNKGRKGEGKKIIITIEKEERKEIISSGPCSSQDSKFHTATVDCSLNSLFCMAHG